MYLHGTDTLITEVQFWSSDWTQDKKTCKNSWSHSHAPDLQPQITSDPCAAWCDPAFKQAKITLAKITI